MLNCSPLGGEGSVDNLSEFEVIVEAAIDKILKKKKKIKYIETSTVTKTRKESRYKVVHLLVV